VIFASASAFHSIAPSEDASQPSTDILVHSFERIPVAVFELFNQPRNVRFRSLQISLMLRPSLRPVFSRIVSLSFAMLFLRGHFWPRSK
ncbi:MAG: hypothetical protein WCP06_03090, partial [Verrucomicrobiota bacterium]